MAALAALICFVLVVFGVNASFSLLALGPWRRPPG